MFWSLIDILGLFLVQLYATYSDLRCMTLIGSLHRRYLAAWHLLGIEALPATLRMNCCNPQHSHLGLALVPHVTGSSHQACIDKYFTRRPAIGVNRDNAHRKCTHCGGVYHSPTQCPVIISQAFDYAPCIKATPIPIPPKPKEGMPTRMHYQASTPEG
jgi:hypothetical protein